MKTNITTITVCRYVVETRAISIRAIARALGIHHRTMQRYLDGSSRPNREIKYKIIRMMNASNYDELVHEAFTFYSIRRSTPKGQSASP